MTAVAGGGGGTRKEERKVDIWGGRIYTAHWATEVGGGAESQVTPGICAGQ